MLIMKLKIFWNLKKETVNEVHGAIGYLSELELIKNTRNSQSLLTPKFLVRYAPGGEKKRRA